MLNPSNEQKHIIDLIPSYNIIVDAVAGSGKTTTNIMIAHEYDNYKILILTYNKRLRLETQDRINKLQLTNCDVHTYHSFIYHIYDTESNEYDDTNMNYVLNNNPTPVESFAYDIIIIDEAQDINPLYLKVINQILADNQCEPKSIIALGDKMQSIYKYNYSKPEYLMYADQYFLKTNDKIWKHATLSESFRLPKQIADFLNDSVLHQKRIISNKVADGVELEYKIMDSFNPYHMVNYIIKQIKLGIKPDDIFVLAPSIRSIKTPVRLLANALSNAGINIYVPTDEGSSLDNSIIKNKVVFSTFHQTKGLERKVVIVYSFDDSYFQYYEQSEPSNKCTNALYVALTRTKLKLVMIHHYKNGHMPFLKLNGLKNITTMRDEIATSVNKISQREVSVTSLARHLYFEDELRILSYVDFICENKKSDLIKPQNSTRQRATKELVSDITGVAIPSYYEYLQTNKMSICDSNQLYRLKSAPYMDIFTEPDELPEVNIQELLKIANEYLANSSGYKFRTNQIQNYDWLNISDLNKCMDRMSYIPTNASYEENVQCEFRGKIINGRLDVRYGNKIYEIKCTSDLSSSHKIQLAIYAFVYETMQKTKDILKAEYRLHNLFTDQCYKLNATYKNLVDLINEIYNIKFES